MVRPPRAARAALVSLTFAALLAALLAPVVVPLAAQSVRIIQRETVRGDSLVERVLTLASDDLNQGAMITLSEGKVRIKRLPM